MERVSIIIPLYNKQDCIADTLLSILNQTYKNIEVLIVNDGSTDKSLDIVKSFKDKRIRIIDKSNEGVSRTRNLGSKEATSELICFFDADDYMYPHCIETLINLRNDYPDADLWSANYQKGLKSSLIDVLSGFPRGYVTEMSKKIWLRQWHFRIGSFICTKASFLDLGGYPTFMTVGEDYYFMDNYIYKYKCAYDPTVVMSYVFESRQLSAGNRPIEDYQEWYIDFCDMWGYRKLRYGELLGVRYISTILKFDWSTFMRYYRKQGHFWYSLYALFRRLTRKFSSNFEKNPTKDGKNEP